MVPDHDTKDFCGIRKPYAMNKIVGGEIATPGEFPWQVAVRIDGLYFCGGSLIDSTHVLTAAHCADGARFFSLTFGSQLSNQNEASQVTVSATRFTIHPNWNPNTLASDMAIITLNAPITFNTRIAPICLIDASAPTYVGDNLVVSGWGKPSDGKATKGILTTLKGSCNADSGGPLSFINSNGIYIQVGVVSAGCEKGFPAFSRVSNYTQWLTDNTGLII